MRRPIMYFIGIMMVLFVPYWDTGFFYDDIGWVFLFSDFDYDTPVLSREFWFEYFSFIIAFLEFISLIVLNKIWRVAGGKAYDASRFVATQSGGLRAEQVDIAAEIGKFNSLRAAGALTEEEFVAEKTRLMSAASVQGAGASVVVLDGLDVGDFPSLRVAAAVAACKQRGVPDMQIFTLLHKTLWDLDIKVPPTPYFDVDQRYFLVLSIYIGFIWSLFFTIIVFLIFDMNFTSFILIFILCSFITFLADPPRMRKFRHKYGLPEWGDLPGAG